jgi:hypothetical protein
MNDIHMKDYYYEKDQERDIFKDNSKIKVIVRKRPINKKELSKNEMDIIEMRTTTSVVVKELK